MANSFHIPVLTKEILNYLNLKKGGVYIDCTVGGGGHSKAILEKIYPHGLLIGIDQDIEAINTAKEELKTYLDKVTLIKGNFKNLEKILPDIKIKTVSGIIFDLGVSFHQLKERERGFSFKENNHLDMRMDTTNKLSAKDIVNNYSERELADIIYKWGEENWAKRIAKFIVDYRGEQEISTTGQLL